MLKVSLLVFGFCLSFAPLVLLAEDAGIDNPPPPCCPRSPGILGEASPIMIQGQFTVSTGMLEAQGINRKQFVDRLSAAFFPNTSADVVVSTKTTVSRNSTNSPNLKLGNQDLPAPGSGLIAIEETLIYRIPLYAVSDGDFEAMEQVGLTDGSIQIVIKFVKGTSLSSNTQ
jgi:hypothetical protein